MQYYEATVIASKFDWNSQINSVQIILTSIMGLNYRELLRVVTWCSLFSCLSFLAVPN